jgi:ribonuclease HI
MKVYVDANPKQYAIVIPTGTTFKVIVGNVPVNSTSNESEYIAILAALEALHDVTEVLSDSQLVVRQLNHDYHIKEDRLRALAEKVWAVADGKVVFTWIPRKENKAGKVLG